MTRIEDRYLNLKSKQLRDGRVVYRPSIVRSIETSENDIRFVANEMDKMDVIANNEFGSPLNWWILAAANKKVNGSLYFKPGQSVVIPRV